MCIVYRYILMSDRTLFAEYLSSFWGSCLLLYIELYSCVLIKVFFIYCLILRLSYFHTLNNNNQLNKTPPYILIIIKQNIYNHPKQWQTG